MALAASDVFTVTYSFRDNNGKIGSVGVAYAAALGYALVENLATQLAAALDAVTDAVLVSYVIGRAVIEGAPAAPPPSSEVERKLLIPLGTARFPNVTSIEVPSPVFTIEQDGTDVPVNNSTALNTLLDALTNGPLGFGNSIVTYYGDDITRTGVPTIVHRNRAARK